MQKSFINFKKKADKFIILFFFSNEINIKITKQNDKIFEYKSPENEVVDSYYNLIEDL